MDTTWKKLEPQSTIDMQQQLNNIATLLDSSPNTHIYHDPVWLLEAEGRSCKDVQIYLATKKGNHIGYAPFIAQPWCWRFRLGEMTLSSTQMNRLYLHGAPLLEANTPQNSGYFSNLLIQMQPKLGKLEMLFFEGVRTDDVFFKAIEQNSIKKLYYILHYGKPYARQFIRLPSNFDDYMQSLSKRTREGLRRNLRKLKKQTNDDFELKRITTPEEIIDFIPKAVEISKKTYQWNLLGLGLRDSIKLKQTLITLAKYNWTRCYILECQKAPVAFMIGYQYRGTYYYIDVGFDPDWSKWSVGSLLHMEVIRDLFEDRDTISMFDFSPGTGEHKERFSNEEHEEINIILLPKTFTNWKLLSTYKFTESVSSIANRLLEKMGIKAKIKKLIRSLSTRMKPATK